MDSWGLATGHGDVQVGWMVGWINTISPIIRHAKADMWIMAE